ncbi:MAG: hypothetical protein KKA07_14730, partial [Bacteroidetes bacterium]|nr:hypothetical protein [Bacteroidota bacterium]
GNGWNYDIYYTQSGDNRKQSFIGNQRVYATTFHNINEWVHLAVTYADGVAKFYLNGQFDNQVTLTGNELNVNTLPVLIGASQGTISGNEYYEGLMDELKIFNCTLTEAQILEIYTTGIEDVARKDALPFFNFDPATGNVIIGSDISIGGVQIWNASGALVYKGVSPKINIADLPEGIFVIQVIEKKTGEIYTSKLLK